MLFGLASTGSNAVQVLIQHTYKTHRHAGTTGQTKQQYYSMVHSLQVHSQQYIYSQQTKDQVLTRFCIHVIIVDVLDQVM